MSIDAPIDQPVVDYRAFLLRCWNESGQWRFSIEGADLDRRYGLADLPALIEFLSAQLRAAPIEPE